MSADPSRRPTRVKADELDDRLTAWWLDIAPTRQEELLMEDPPAMPWLQESLDTAGLELQDVQQFLDRRRSPGLTRDAGVNPRPE